MILFILGIVIGSIGGMIMMAMFLTGKSRESSFADRTSKCSPSDTAATDTGYNSTKKSCR